MSAIALPREVLGCAVTSGEELGWRPAFFLDALRLATASGFACLGEQFQWVFPDGTCEAYWLNADSSARDPQDSWQQYLRKCEREVSAGFRHLLSTTDFDEEANRFDFLREKKATGLPIHDHLIFVADFIPEDHDV